MLTFKELEEPVSGWALDRIERTRGGLWEVTLRRGETFGRLLTGAACRTLEAAWGSVCIAAENADVQSRDRGRIAR